MPFIRTTTTETITKEKAEILKEKLGCAIALIPGKSEAYLMLEFKGDAAMAFRGDSTTPLAMVEVQLLGSASVEYLDALNKRVTEILEDTLGVPKDRIYVNFSHYERWGSGGELF